MTITLRANSLYLIATKKLTIWDGVFYGRKYARSPMITVTLTALFAALCGLYFLSEVSGWLLLAVPGTTPSRAFVMVVAGLLWRSKRAALCCMPPRCWRQCDLGVWGSGLTSGAHAA